VIAHQASRALGEAIHEQAYIELGFRLVEVPAGPLADRVALIRQTAGRLAAGPDDRRGSSSAGQLTGRAGWPASQSINCPV
jgi:hypothetical protein